MSHASSPHLRLCAHAELVRREDALGVRPELESSEAVVLRRREVAALDVVHALRLAGLKEGRPKPSRVRRAKLVEALVIAMLPLKREDLGRRLFPRQVDGNGLSDRCTNGLDNQHDGVPSTGEEPRGRPLQHALRGLDRVKTDPVGQVKAVHSRRHGRVTPAECSDVLGREALAVELGVKAAKGLDLELQVAPWELWKQ